MFESFFRSFSIVFLIQKADAKTEKCTEKDSAADLPPGYACTFNWFHIVENQDHPCSDNNMYGFKREEPCVLVKVNKVKRCVLFFFFSLQIESFRFTVGHHPVVHYQSLSNNYEASPVINLLSNRTFTSLVRDQ